MDETIRQSYIKFATCVKKYSPNTIREYLRVINAVSEHVDILHAERPSLIDEAIVKSVNKKNWDENYTFKMSCIVKAFTRWAKESEKAIPENTYSFSGFRKPKAKRPQFVTQEDFELHMSNPNLTSQDISLLTLLWVTAVRVEECANISQNDIVFNQNGGFVKIPPEKSKGGYGEREIPIPPFEAEIIKRQILRIRSQVKHNCLFVGRTWEPMTPNSITDRVRSIGEMVFPAKPDVVRLTPHMFRHGRAVIWHLNGVPDSIIKRWLGHNSTEMMTHYTNLSAEYSQRMHRKLMPQLYPNEGDKKLIEDIKNNVEFPSYKVEAPSQILV